MRKIQDRVKKDIVIENFNKMLFLREHEGEFKVWLLDVMKYVETLNKKEFTLDEIYKFENILKTKHPNNNNNNIQAKIR